MSPGSQVRRRSAEPGNEPPSPAIDEVAAAVADRGWCVAPGFLAPAEVAAIAGEARQLWESGDFRRAGVGHGRDLQVRPEIRSDFVHWIDPATATPAIGRYLGRVEALRLALNERAFLGLFDFEAHLTIYPPAAFYRRHLDRFRAVPWRTVSLVLYLAEGWRPEDGGELRLYLDPAGEGEAVDVPPAGGTLVAFLSEQFWHEVLPARRERMSLTGWLTVRRASP